MTNSKSTLLIRINHWWDEDKETGRVKAPGLSQAMVIPPDGFPIQWWFVNPGSDNPEISLIRTKSAGTDFRSWTDGRFSNPENSLIRKYRPGTNVCGLTNHHCTHLINVLFDHLSCLYHIAIRGLPLFKAFWSFEEEVQNVKSLQTIDRQWIVNNKLHDHDDEVH